MFLILPIGTDAPQRRRPTVNYALIAVNALAYVVFNILAAGSLQGGHAEGSYLLEVKNNLILWPDSPLLHQFLTYQFLHANWWHIIGNMWFLYLFGNPVNSKMGHVPYLFFYLAGGVFAGLGFSLMEINNPVVGASGAIAAVTTAYLVLYPRSTIRLFYWVFLFIGDLEVGSILMIVGKMIVWDNILMADMGSEGRSVAYEAHLAGYAFGFVAALLLLAARALPRDPFDILALWSRWRRRAQFATIFREPEFRPPVAEPARNVREALRMPTARPASGPYNEIDRLRSEISLAVDNFDLPKAARLYRELLALDPNQALSRSNQLDVANQLTSEGDFTRAVQAYERYLERYPKDSTARHVQFLLGVICARHLKDYPKAVQHLEACRCDLTDPGMIDQCRYWLEVAKDQGSPDKPAEPG